MRSMTGFATAQAAGSDGAAYIVEARGYNSRFLDVSVTLPPECQAAEWPLRERVAAHCLRGKVELTVTVRRAEAGAGLRLNRAAFQAVLDAAREARAMAGGDIEGGLTLAAALALPGVLTADEAAAGGEAADPALYRAVDEALALFDAERQREGETARASVLAQLDAIDAAREAVARLAGGLEAAFEAGLRRKFAEIVGERYDESRVLAEVAALLVKYTTCEELDRLAAHIAAFRAGAAASDEPAAAVGKKLDFLCQEMNREINTIGSKTPALEVTRAVVAMKDALENIREQLRNVE